MQSQIAPRVDHGGVRTGFVFIGWRGSCHSQFLESDSRRSGRAHRSYPCLRARAATGTIQDSGRDECVQPADVERAAFGAGRFGCRHCDRYAASRNERRHAIHPGGRADVCGSVAAAGNRIPIGIARLFQDFRHTGGQGAHLYGSGHELERAGRDGKRGVCQSLPEGHGPSAAALVDRRDHSWIAEAGPGGRRSGRSSESFTTSGLAIFGIPFPRWMFPSRNRCRRTCTLGYVRRRIRRQ